MISKSKMFKIIITKRKIHQWTDHYTTLKELTLKSATTNTEKDAEQLSSHRPTVHNSALTLSS